MIEVLDIQKNFKTGKEIRKSKLKDNSMTKGVATIELFDKDNNLVEKTVSNNFINNIYDGAYIYKYMSNLLSGRSHSSSYPVSAVQFGQIQLRNGDFEEDKNALFMKGNVVGWCPRTSTSAGTDTTRGVYNPTESFTEFTNDGYFHSHLVYDFLTSQANGTINHVYWCMDNHVTSMPSLGTITKLYNSTIDVSNGGSFTISNSKGVVGYDIDVYGNLYGKKNDKYYKIENKYQFLNGFKELEIDENQPIGLADIEHQSNRINDDFHIRYALSYKTGTSSTRECTVKLELVNTKTKEVTKTVNLDIINDFEAMKTLSSSVSGSATIQVSRINTCTESGNIYMNMYINGFSINVVNPDGSQGSYYGKTKDFGIVYNIFEDTWIVQPNIQNYACYSLTFGKGFNLKKEEGVYYVFSGGEIVEVDEINLVKTSLEKKRFAHSYGGTNDLNYYFNFYYGCDYNSNTILGRHGNSSSILALNKILPYTSHTKLPSPVTKTNTTTMKVTYDYYIQVPNMLAEKGKEFIWE